MVNLRESGETLDFLGYSFRLDRSLYGADKPRYWNMHPSKKSLAREREKLRGMISLRRCYQQLPEMIAQINRHLKGWANYYGPGYSRCEDTAGARSGKSTASCANVWLGIFAEAAGGSGGLRKASALMLTSRSSASSTCECLAK